MCSSAGPEEDAARVEAARTGDLQRQRMELERVDAERFVELGRQRSEQETFAELERQRLEQERRGAEVLERQRVEHERPAVAQRAQSRIRRNKAPVLDKHVLDEAMLETQCGQQLLKHQNKEEEKQEAILETERTRSAEAVKRSRAHGRVFRPDGRMVCFGEHILSTRVAEHASLSCRKCGSRIHSGAVYVACIAGDFQACGRCAKQVLRMRTARVGCCSCGGPRRYLCEVRAIMRCWTA